MIKLVQNNVALTLQRHQIFHAVCAASLPQPIQLPQAANLNAPVIAAPRPFSLASSRQRDAGKGWYLNWGKHAFESALILLTLPLWLPILMACTAALWLEGGQPFYWQGRLGKDGKRFHIVKLRTMVRDADARLAEYLASDPAMREEWETTQKLKKDPRITRVGAFLRATSLDEVPQFWNVLRGEMSLVGPRPMMPDQLPLYGDAHAYFALKPGITGLWQVSARNESRFDYRAKVDADYFLGVSLKFDALLIVRTVGVVLRQTGY